MYLIYGVHTDSHTEMFAFFQSRLYKIETKIHAYGSSVQTTKITSLTFNFLLIGQVKQMCRKFCFNNCILYKGIRHILGFDLSSQSF